MRQELLCASEVDKSRVVWRKARPCGQVVARAHAGDVVVDFIGLLVFVFWVLDILDGCWSVEAEVQTELFDRQMYAAENNAF